jgi:hypothetical protein
MWGIILKKYRLSTTISMKHWAILKKLVERYETQQKAIELALDNLNNPGQGRTLTPDEELWLLVGRVKSTCVVQKDGLRILMETADIDRWADYVARLKPFEYVTEVCCQKPLKECSLKDIIEAHVFNARVSKQYDIIDYSDDGDHYTLKLTHDLGLNNSKMLKVLYESLFNTYGARNEYQISERSIFVKVYKPQ